MSDLSQSEAPNLVMWRVRVMQLTTPAPWRRGHRCTGGERTRVSADTLVKMAEDSFIASVNYHTYWGYCRWYEEHWGGGLSRDRQSFSRNSNLKSCVVTRVVHISVFLVSRVTVFHVEGDATVDEGDACLIGQTVIDISRFHFMPTPVQYYQI